MNTTTAASARTVFQVTKDTVMWMSTELLKDFKGTLLRSLSEVIASPRHGQMIWLAGSPVMFCCVMIKSLRNKVFKALAVVKRTIEDCDESDDEQDSELTEITILIPAALSIPGFNFVFLFFLFLARSGYVISVVLPAMFIASSSSLFSRALLILGAYRITNNNPLLISNTATHFIKIGIVIDAVIMCFTAWPCFTRFRQQLYIDARNDVLKEIAAANR